MNKFMFERVDEIRFERGFDDGSKVSFAIGEPKTFNLENASYLITVGNPPMNLTELLHRWDSVFDPNTQIIICGEVHEFTDKGFLVKEAEGEFDFKELCKGNMVCLKSYNRL